MMFLADDSAIVSGLIDVVGKILLPVLIALCTTTVALYAIYKTDQRERHKRRRDGVIAVALEFIKTTDDFAAKFREVYTTLQTEFSGKEGSKFRNSSVELALSISVHARKLELMNEESLRKDVLAYMEDSRENHEAFIAFLKAIRTTITQPQFDEAHTLQMQLIRRTRLVMERFKEEVARLDHGSFGLLDKVFSKL